MNVTEVKPLPRFDEENNIIQTEAKKVRESDFSPEREFKKLKYAIHKYVFENITNERIVSQRNLNIETFALNLFDLHEELVEEKIIISLEYNPVLAVDTISRQRGSGSGRPDKRRMTTRYTLNPKVKKTDWTHQEYSLESLLDDSKPFDASVIVLNNNSMQE
ncbi:hypothetical protein G6F43_013580 [Rhizopus delemar]|nr:hypothetical protein G6F43_013580 [Rhizopus delemar]